MENEKINPIACAETYEIIKNSSNDIQEKIPEKFITFLKNNMTTQAQKTVRKEQQYDTKILLEIIYRDFLCTEDAKNMLIAKEKKELAEEQITDTKPNDSIISYGRTVTRVPQNLSLIKYENPKWYGKIWKVVRTFFKRNGWVLWE